MKKTFIIILISFTLMNYIYKKNNTKNNEIKKDLSNDYIETIPENAKPFIMQLTNNDIILTTDNIEKYNKKIVEKNDSMYNLESITTLTKNDVLELITKYKVPSIPKYNGNKEVTKYDIEIMKEHCSTAFLGATFSCQSYTALASLPRDGTTHSGQGPAISFNN